MANAGKGMGHETVIGHPNVGTTDPSIMDEDDIANHLRGNNKLQGKDQSQVHNQRLTMPGQQSDTDDGRGSVDEHGAPDREARRS